MNRRAVLLWPATLLAVACSSPKAFVLPSTVEGWTLVSSRGLPPGSAPPEVSQYGLRRVWEGNYRGPAELSATVYEFNGSAFEPMQKWRREAGSFPFYSGRFLVVLRAAGTVDRTVYERFSRAFEASLPEH